MSDSDLPIIYHGIDTTDLEYAMAMAAAMQRAECGIKLGMEFFNAHGPQGIRDILSAYEEISLFVDLKYHDIPNTVAGAVRAITALEPDFINVHATGGLEMMVAAKNARDEQAAKVGVSPPKLLGVTILTSLDQNAAEQIGFEGSVKDNVIRLARLTKEAGLDGIVCSPQEIEIIRREMGNDFILMVPGIRPQGSNTDDQKRIMTPEEAVHIGADHIVMARPIANADDPAAFAGALNKKLRGSV